VIAMQTQPFDDFDTAPWLLPVMPPQQTSEDYQRDAIAGAQSTMPDDEPGEL